MAAPGPTLLGGERFLSGLKCVSEGSLWAHVQVIQPSVMRIQPAEDYQDIALRQAESGHPAACSIGMAKAAGLGLVTRGRRANPSGA